MAERRQHRRLRNRLWRKNPECFWCGVHTIHQINSPLQATLDHVIPISWNGKDAASNIVLSCHKCNQRRGFSESDWGFENWSAQKVWKLLESQVKKKGKKVWGNGWHRCWARYYPLEK